ncbi:KpsF/GutQ family sugar-phosphate isomerase [bacterium]|nr:KpsF/GutQ family sugar-phosphate isomerase [bacterium]MBU1153742.1 KpsF/GutQ family sugar-phosphate isomerase [bacterium]MBU2600373.1 KpsF/GutQ family sugar-phosphate isomerase [bacterium]
MKRGVTLSLKVAKKVLKIEAEAILNLRKKLSQNFLEAVEVMFLCKGKIIITGVGKSGIIGKKMAATLTSTGTPSFFLHSAEGLHGDLGIIEKKDVVLAISNSGEAKEIIEIIPFLKRLGVKLIGITSQPHSTLAKSSDMVLDVGVEKEACSLNLAPTASSTATLALGDALAITLLEKKNFKEKDFALLHPGGSLGRKLFFKIADLMHIYQDVPKVFTTTLMKDTLLEMSFKKLGFTCVVDQKESLVGIITDGDLRRLLEKTQNIWPLQAAEVMVKNPKTILKEDLAAKAVAIMEKHSITSLIIVDQSKKVIGVIHLHDLLKAGVV